MNAPPPALSPVLPSCFPPGVVEGIWLPLLHPLPAPSPAQNLIPKRQGPGPGRERPAGSSAPSCQKAQDVEARRAGPRGGARVFYESIFLQTEGVLVVGPPTVVSLPDLCHQRPHSSFLCCWQSHVVTSHTSAPWASHSRGSGRSRRSRPWGSTSVQGTECWGGGRSGFLPTLSQAAPLSTVSLLILKWLKCNAPSPPLPRTACLCHSKAAGVKQGRPAAFQWLPPTLLGTKYI